MRLSVTYLLCRPVWIHNSLSTIRLPSAPKLLADPTGLEKGFPVFSGIVSSDSEEGRTHDRKLQLLSLYLLDLNRIASDYPALPDTLRSHVFPVLLEMDGQRNSPAAFAFRAPSWFSALPLSLAHIASLQPTPEGCTMGTASVSLFTAVQSSMPVSTEATLAPSISASAVGVGAFRAAPVEAWLSGLSEGVLRPLVSHRIAAEYSAGGYATWPPDLDTKVAHQSLAQLSTVLESPHWFRAGIRAVPNLILGRPSAATWRPHHEYSTPVFVGLRLHLPKPPGFPTVQGHPKERAEQKDSTRVDSTDVEYIGIGEGGDISGPHPSPPAIKNQLDGFTLPSPVALQGFLRDLFQ